MIYFQLFYEFFLIGLFCIGGGMAALPFLSDLADKTGWYTHEALVDMIAISESTPGPIGINMATYVGFSTGGILGSVLATVGIVLPSLVIVIILARFLQRFQSSKLVQDLFYGLRPAVAGLIAAAGLQVMRVTLVDIVLYQDTGALADLFAWPSLILFALLLTLTMTVKKLHPVAIIAIAAVVGIVFKL